MAQAFLKLKMQDSACFYIRRAAIHEKKKDLKGRYFYITGQLFEAAKKMIRPIGPTNKCWN